MLNTSDVKSLSANGGTISLEGINNELASKTLDADTLYSLLTSNASNIDITKSNDKVKIEVPDKATVQNLTNTEYFYLNEVYSPDGSDTQPSTDTTNSVIISDSHTHDLIFRFTYGGIEDVKLSELARKSEMPSSGTYYRHLVRLYNTETFDEANNIVFFELISTSMVAIDSTQDLTTYAVGAHTCTGFIGSIGTTYGPPVSITIAATGAPKIYFADASTNFSKMLSGTAISLGLTHIADTVANI